MKNDKRKAAKVGIFSFTCCEGCQLQILDLWDRLLEMLRYIDISYFKLADEKNVMGRFDIAIVEGAISEKEELEKLKKIRENSKLLVVIGECAVSGGIPAMRNVKKIRRPKMLPKTQSVDRHVKVDYRLRGCPIEREEFLSLITSLLVDRMPQEINHPVCMECNQREIECLMLKGIPCMGPITCAGCNALCPAAGTPCEGCRGTMKDAGIRQLKVRLEEIGVSRKMIKNMLERFSSDEIKGMERAKNDRK